VLGALPGGPKGRPFERHGAPQTHHFVRSTRRVTSPPALLYVTPPSQLGVVYGNVMTGYGSIINHNTPTPTPTPRS
jgi:hypothetical protein